MDKLTLLKLVLERAGDPNAESKTYRNLAWSLFIESAYEANPSLSLVESKYYLTHAPIELETDSNGIVLYDELAWASYSEMVDISISTDKGYIPTSPVSQEQYTKLLGNPYLLPDSEHGNYEFYHYFDGKNIALITGLKSTKITIQIRTYPDLQTLLGTLAESGVHIPLHNSLIRKLIPITAKKFRDEVGLTL